MSEQFFLTEKGLKVLQWERNVFYQTPGIKEFFYKENEVLLKYLEKTQTALDVGCGLGTHLILLSKYCKEIVGIDHSEAVLKRCRKEIKDIPNIKVHSMNAKSMVFPDNSFDQSSCMFNTLGNMDDPTLVLQEMKRVTKQTGHIVFSLYNTESIPERLEFYHKTGIQSAYPDGVTLRNKDGGDWFSKSYTEEGIKKLCDSVGLEVVIYPTRISWVCDAVKK